MRKINKMKIAIFHELHTGGGRKAVNEIARVLKKRHHVDLYLVDNKVHHGENIFFHNIFFYQFIPKIWRGNNWRVKLYKDSFELWQLYQLHKKIAEVIDKKQYDVVFIHPSQFTQAPFLLRMLKTKKIYYCEEQLRIVYDPYFSLGKMNFLKKVYEVTNRFIRKRIDEVNIHHADVIVANSFYTQNRIEKAYSLKSIVRYLGVNQNIFSPMHVKKDIDILYIGSRLAIDGFDLLQESLSIIKSKPVVYTHLTGESKFFTDAQLCRLYARSKIVVCLAINEPFGLIPLEAMACGVPVIAVNDGGYKETVVSDKTGYLVPRNPKKVAEKINHLLTDTKKRTAFSVNAREHVLKRWTWDIATQRLESILKAV